MLYVNPKDPSQTRLSNSGASWGDYLACLILGLCWVWGVLVVWLGHHPHKIPLTKENFPP